MPTPNQPPPQLRPFPTELPPRPGPPFNNRSRDRDRDRVLFVEADDETPLLPPPYPYPRRYHREERGCCARCLIILFFLVLFTTISMVGFWFGYHWGHDPTLAGCEGFVTVYSPVLEDLSLSTTTIPFNGSLLASNPYRQDAGPTVDAAWSSLGVDYRALSVPESLAERSGIASDQVKIAHKYGGGYPANVEGLHHLHCLNLLRQGLWFNVEYYREKGEGAFKNEDFILRKHMTHCLDILRQQLMCVVDVGVMGQVWIHPEAPEAYVDFNTKHKCRDFEAIREWAQDRQIPAKIPKDFLEPPKEGDRIYDEIP